MGSLLHKVKRRGFGDQVATVWFLLPILLVFVILTIIPLSQSIFWSFTDYNGYSANPTPVGLDNYKAVLKDTELLSGMGFTLLYTAGVTLFTTVLAIPLAVVLNEKFFGRDLARGVFFFLSVPSMAVIGLVWRYIFSPLDSGVVNNVLVKLGIDTLPWLADPSLAKFAIIFIAVWSGTGWHATLYLAYLQAIPKDLYEQATIDGAGPFQRFFHITVPQLIPGIAVSTFLLISGGLKVYDLPYTLTKGGPGYSTYTITQSIIQRGVAQGDYGVGSALAVIFTIATLIVILAQVWVTSVVSRRYT